MNSRKDLPYTYPLQCSREPLEEYWQVLSRRVWMEDTESGGGVGCSCVFRIESRSRLPLIFQQIVEGAATIGWAICAAFILPDFPSNTKKFNAREKELAISRLEADHAHHRSEDNMLSSLQALKQALSSWQVWLMTAGYMVIVGSSTLSYFYPTLVGINRTQSMPCVFDTR